MSNAARPDEFPSVNLDQFPYEIRWRLRAQGKATAAKRVYSRRGWNTQALDFEIRRRSRELEVLFDELEYSENNPPLF